MCFIYLVLYSRVTFFLSLSYDAYSFNFYYQTFMPYLNPKDEPVKVPILDLSKKYFRLNGKGVRMKEMPRKRVMQGRKITFRIPKEIFQLTSKETIQSMEEVEEEEEEEEEKGKEEEEEEENPEEDLHFDYRSDAKSEFKPANAHQERVRGLDEPTSSGKVNLHLLSC